MMTLFVPSLAALLAAGISGTTPRELEQVRQTHGTMIRELGTVVLQECVLIDGADRPEADAATRAELTRLIEDQIAKAERAARLPKEQSDHAVAALFEELERVEATVRVSQLNRRVMVERTTSLDFHNRRLAEKDRDLRDVADLVRTNGLGPLDAATLDQTITRILDGDRSIELYPSADRLAFVSGPADFNADVVLTRLGLLPDWVFESGFDLELIPRVPGMTQEVRLVARKNGVTRVIADLSSEYGYRLTRLRLNSDQGELLQDTLLTGFRKVGGRWVPSEVNVRVMRPGDRQELRIERHQIRQVDFNVEIEPTEFRIPSNYRIQSVSP